MIWKNTLNRLLALSVIMALMGWKVQEGEPTPSEQLVGFCQEFDQLQIDIREYNVSPDSAARAFQAVMRNIRQTMTEIDSCQNTTTTKFVYPVRGYQPKYSIGGRGRGYRDKNFNLFDMEVRGSHPAHDLFIRDGNQDNLDDRLFQPVDLLSFSGGVVLATDTTWQPGSELRGGKYIWVYDPCLNGLFYYAHNNQVNVLPGQLVKAGQKLGEIGRTGLNAYKERSPTHVHMMFLRLDGTYLPQPENTLAWLRESEVVEWSASTSVPAQPEKVKLPPLLPLTKTHPSQSPWPIRLDQIPVQAPPPALPDRYNRAEKRQLR